MNIPPTILALALTLVVAAQVAFLAGGRGGRFRGLPGWVGYWGFFGAFLVCLARAPHYVSFPVLALVMFVGLKEYFFLAPVRPQDRLAILAAYLSVPASLLAAYYRSYGGFLASILLFLFLVLPALVASGPPQPGLMDSMGRVLWGVLVFVFCTAHLGWMVHEPAARLELFGVLALSCELPQRLTGKIRPGRWKWRPLGGALIGGLAAVGLGWGLAPLAGLAGRHGLVAGALVGITVPLGGVVAEGVMHDLSLGSAGSRFGRAMFLDRTVPVIYAAPLYFHYLSHFA